MECFITQRSSSYYSQYVKEYLIASQHDKAPNILHEPLRKELLIHQSVPIKTLKLNPESAIGVTLIYIIFN